MDQQVEIRMDIGGHSETLTFNVAPLGKHNIVLGLLWLQWHNPMIHWKSGKVTFISNYCEEHCLAQPASTFLNQQPIVPTVVVENKVSEITVEPLLEEEVDIFAVEIPEHLELVAKTIWIPIRLRSTYSMDRGQLQCCHLCVALMSISRLNWMNQSHS